MTREEIVKELELLQKLVLPTGDVHEAFIQMTYVMRCFVEYMEERVDE